MSSIRTELERLVGAVDRLEGAVAAREARSADMPAADRNRAQSSLDLEAGQEAAREAEPGGADGDVRVRVDQAIERLEAVLRG